MRSPPGLNRASSRPNPPSPRWSRLARRFPRWSWRRLLPSQRARTNLRLYPCLHRHPCLHLPPCVHPHPCLHLHPLPFPPRPPSSMPRSKPTTRSARRRASWRGSLSPRSSSTTRSWSPRAWQPVISTRASKTPSSSRSSSSTVGYPRRYAPTTCTTSSYGSSRAATRASSGLSTRRCAERGRDPPRPGSADAPGGSFRVRSLSQALAQQAGDLLGGIQAALGVRSHLDEAVGQLGVVGVRQIVARRRQLARIGVSDVAQHVEAAGDHQGLGQVGVAGRIERRDIGLRVVLTLLE